MTKNPGRLAEREAGAYSEVIKKIKINVSMFMTVSKRFFLQVEREMRGGCKGAASQGQIFDGFRVLMIKYFDLPKKTVFKTVFFTGGAGDEGGCERAASEDDRGGTGTEKGGQGPRSGG